MDSTLDGSEYLDDIDEVRGASTTAIDDIAYLARSKHRVTVLDALAERPRSRSELGEMTGVSPSTTGRMLREFETRHWVRRNGHRYEATQLGSFVASGATELLERIETERELRAVWQWLPTEASELSIEMLSESVVTIAETGDPYRPVNRFASLLRETARFQFVGPDLALLEPCKDEFRERVVEGMDTEIIDPPSVARYVLSTYPDHCSTPLESGHLAVLLHDDLPSYGVSIFDARIGISCYNPVNGTVQAFVDTDAPEAREWAISTYESFRAEARPLDREPIVE